MLSGFLNCSTNVSGKTLFMCRSLNQSLTHIAFVQTWSPSDFHRRHNRKREKSRLLETDHQIYISNTNSLESHRHVSPWRHFRHNDLNSCVYNFPKDAKHAQSKHALAVFIHDVTPARTTELSCRTPRRVDRKEPGCDRSSQAPASLDLPIFQLRERTNAAWRSPANRRARSLARPGPTAMTRKYILAFTHYCAQSMSWYSLDLSKHAFTPSSFHSFFA